MQYKPVQLSSDITNYLDNVKGEKSYNEILCQLLGLTYKKNSKKMQSYPQLASMEIGDIIQMDLSNPQKWFRVRGVLAYQKRRYGKEFHVGTTRDMAKGYPVTRLK